ncbi:DUF3592 domain-containing protein [Parafrankia sp. FMc2]|uniref:DUF3592 domain-containing protein n=1 Tax=Parafrankia sp. FMc2 TaxID=3233196 RepID=UPI0034D3D2E4
MGRSQGGAGTAPFRLGIDVVWKAVAAGFLLLAVAGYFFHVNAVLGRYGIDVVGEVLDAGGPRERPTVRFVTRAGTPVETMIMTDGEEELRVGEMAAVEYDERNPHRARLPGSRWYWELPVGAAAIGLATPAVAVWIFFRRRREYPGWESLTATEIADVLAAPRAPWWPGAPAADAADALGTHSRRSVQMLRRDQQEIHRMFPAWDLWGVSGEGSVERWPAGQRLSTAVDEVWCRRRRGEPWRLKVILLDRPPSPERTTPADQG